MADVTTRYLLDAGGKRVRPMLALLIAQLGEGNTQQVVDAAVAIEITHLASLYHDDVMDEADMRRGVPSAQAVWGNSVAILAGDLLFARASKIVADLGPRAIRLQAATFERLVLGQLHETIGPRDDQDPIEHYLDVLADKTGSLIACAAQMGVIYSGADPELESAVLAFGERTGVAFQLVDDVLDLADQPEETGKLAGTDLRAGVATLPSSTCAGSRSRTPPRRRCSPGSNATSRTRRRPSPRPTSPRPSPSCATTRSRPAPSRRRTAGPPRRSTRSRPSRRARSEGADALRRHHRRAHALAAARPRRLAGIRTTTPPHGRHGDDDEPENQ